MLVGRIGTGKSSTGNNMFGKHKFLSKHLAGSVTSKCQLEYGKIRDIKYRIVDTPGLFEAGADHREVLLEIQRAGTLCPMFHAFVIVFHGDNRFSEEDALVSLILQILFGNKTQQNVVLAFTRGNSFQSDECFRKYLESSDELKLLVQYCNGRVCKIENGTNAKIYPLLDEIEGLSNVPYRIKKEQYKRHRKILTEELGNERNKNIKAVVEAVNERLKSEPGLDWKDIAKGTAIGALLLTGVFTGGAAIVAYIGAHGVVALAGAVVAAKGALGN